jgi:hypothetical protein
VLHRDELKATTQIPWRLLGLIAYNNKPAALLIRPEIHAENALNPRWDQQTITPLIEDLTRTLIPVFPLPDGTEDPGWKT